MTGLARVKRTVSYVKGLEICPAALAVSAGWTTVGPPMRASRERNPRAKCRAWPVHRSRPRRRCVARWERKIAASGYSRRTARDARSTLTTVLNDTIPVTSRPTQPSVGAARAAKGSCASSESKRQPRHGLPRFAYRADEIRAPVTSSLRTAGTGSRQRRETRLWQSSSTAGRS